MLISNRKNTIFGKELIPILGKFQENASLENKEITQGVNSWISSMEGLNKNDASHFGGSAPPDKDNIYNITLYALDKEINLQSWFYLNELYSNMKGHVLDKVVLKAKYKK